MLLPETRMRQSGGTDDLHCLLPPTEAQHPHSFLEYTTLLLIAGFLPTTPSDPKLWSWLNQYLSLRKPLTFIHIEDDHTGSRSIKTKQNKTSL